jgi:hypothetical protein
VIVPDLNLLIYAVNEVSKEHEGARAWWERAMSGPEEIGVPWIVLLGFLRLTTSPRVFDDPLTPTQSWELIEEWIEHPNTMVIHPGPKHLQFFKTLVLENGTAGNLTTDAHLAVLCIERGATLYTADNDFSRFTSLKWKNPLSGEVR